MENFLILLNKTGDVALTWDKEDDTEILTYIQKRMNEGYVFFILERGFFKLKERKKYVANVNEIGKKREVYLDDADAEDLVKNGKFNITKVEGNTSNINTVRRAKTVNEVIKNQTVATRPLQGG